MEATMTTKVVMVLLTLSLSSLPLFFHPPVSLSGKNASVAAFTAPTVVGNVNANSYLFELTVTDNDGLMDTATSKIVVEKSPIR
jgi:hypothetical protein